MFSYAAHFKDTFSVSTHQPNENFGYGCYIQEVGLKFKSDGFYFMSDFVLLNSFCFISNSSTTLFILCDTYKTE